MTVEERQRELRAELRQLDSSDHPVHAEQKRRDYVEALRRERVGVEARHAAALARGDKHERIPSPFRRGEFVDGELSGFEAGERCARNLTEIDAEIDRVTAQSLSDGDYSRESGGEGTS